MKSKNTSSFLVFFITAILFLASCQGTNSSGTGLTLRDPKPPVNSEVQQMSQGVIDTYKSTLGIPDEGTTKIIEFSEGYTLESGDPCEYLVREISTLVNREKNILIGIKYKQIPDEKNIKECSPKIPRYNDHTKTMDFTEYTNKVVALFLSYSDVDSLLQANPKMRSAQVLAMQSKKIKNMDALFVRMKMTDLYGESYLLETSFSSQNSFINIIEQEFSSIKTNEIISYKKLIID